MQTDLIAQNQSSGPSSIYVFVFVCIMCMYTNVCVLVSVQRGWKKFSWNFKLKTYIDSLTIIGKSSFSIMPFFMVGFPNYQEENVKVTSRMSPKGLVDSEKIWLTIVQHFNTGKTYTSKWCCKWVKTFSLFNTLRTGSFKLFKRPLPGFLTILTL